MTALECLNNVSFYVGPRGFNEKMKVTISTRCECECDDPVEPQHPHCARQGEVKCGTCKYESHTLSSPSSVKTAFWKWSFWHCLHLNKFQLSFSGFPRCNKGYTGQKCECSQGNLDDVSLRQMCRRENNTECEGRGDCVCGQCQCHTSPSGQPYYSKYCECDDEHCQMHDNKPCSGTAQ